MSSLVTNAEAARDCPASTSDYEPSSILVTGGAGFIASHVVLRLATLYPQYSIVVIDKLDYCASLENIRSIVDSGRVILVRGDILDGALLRRILQENAVDTVLHFAAQTHVDNSFGNSIAFTLNNTLGTHVLLEACRETGGIRRFINVSTDEVYGDSSADSDVGMKETSTLEPTNPYSAAKAGAEMLVKAYQCSYNLPCIITRGNNVYGPHQFPEKLIPKFTLLAAKGHALPVHGNGRATRSYLYVEDVAEAFDVILHRGADGQTYNIGTQEERSVLDVAHDVTRSVAAYLGRPSCSSEGPTVCHVRDRLFNDRRYFICDQKLVALGWREKTPWEEGLRRTIEWYLTPDRVSKHWQPDVIEQALRPHPMLGERCDSLTSLASPSTGATPSSSVRLNLGQH